MCKADGNTYVCTCAICGKASLAQTPELYPGGPPITFCSIHRQQLKDDPDQLAMYCMTCLRVTVVLHQPGHMTDMVIFVPDCPICNKDFQLFEGKTWTELMKQDSSRSSSPWPDGAG